MTELFAVLASIAAILGVVVPAVRWVIRRLGTDDGRRRGSDETAEDDAQVLTLLRNSHFLSKHVDVHGYYAVIPGLTCLGELKVDDATRTIAAELKGKVTIDKSTRHAILPSADYVRNRLPEWQYYYTDFATILARRKMAVEARTAGDPATQPFLQISACAVVFCEESKELLLHRRSDISHSYAGRYHTFGGGYIVPECHWKRAKKLKPTPSRQDRRGMVETVSRELREETGIMVNSTAIASVRRVAITELDTGYVQLVALGINIPRLQIESELDNEPKEGGVVRCPFDELRQLIGKPSAWVPTGLTHVLLWLWRAVGASGAPLMFGRETGEQLVKRAIEQLDASGYDDSNVLNY